MMIAGRLTAWLRIRCRIPNRGAGAFATWLRDERLMVRGLSK